MNGENGGFTVENISMKLITATVAVIVLQAFAIPTIVDFSKGPGIHPGDSWDYTVQTNIDGAVITIEGDAQQYQTITGNYIKIVWPDGSEGHHQLIIKAVTEKPHQEQIKLIEFDVGGSFEYEQLILVIPTLMIVAIIVYMVQPIRRSITYGGYQDDGIEQDISNDMK